MSYNCETRKMRKISRQILRKYSRISSPFHLTSSRRGTTPNRVLLNISGVIYETQEKTLRLFPNTLLGDQRKRLKYYCTTTQSYFFDRFRIFFDAILFFYQSGGILRRPYGVPYDLFVEECRFFELPESAILDHKPNNFNTLSTDEKSPEDGDSGFSGIKSKIWNFMENPKSSSYANYFSSLSLFAVVLSVVSACVQSTYRSSEFTDLSTENPMAIVELVLNTFFLGELTMRALATPNIRQFMLR